MYKLTIKHPSGDLTYELPSKPWTSSALNSAVYYLKSSEERHAERKKEYTPEKIQTIIDKLEYGDRLFIRTSKHGDYYYMASPETIELTCRHIIIDLIDVGWLFGEDLLDAYRAISKSQCYIWLTQYSDEYFSFGSERFERITEDENPIYTGEYVSEKGKNLFEELKDKKEKARQAEIERKKSEIDKLQREINDS